MALREWSSCSWKITHFRPPTSTYSVASNCQHALGGRIHNPPVGGPRLLLGFRPSHATFSENPRQRGYCCWPIASIFVMHLIGPQSHPEASSAQDRHRLIFDIFGNLVGRSSAAEIEAPTPRPDDLAGPERTQGIKGLRLMPCSAQTRSHCREVHHRPISNRKTIQASTGN